MADITESVFVLCGKFAVSSTEGTIFFPLAHAYAVSPFSGECTPYMPECGVYQ